MQIRYSRMATCHEAMGCGLLMTNPRGEGKAGQMWVADFDAYFGESALMISITHKI